MLIYPLFSPILPGVRHGYGKHYELLNSSYVRYFFKCLFTGEILYAGVICFAKYSILALLLAHL